MKRRRKSARLALALTGSLAASLAVAAPSMAAEVETLYGLTASDKLVTFSSERPGTTSAPLTLTGLAMGDDVESIDFRPATGELFALIKNGTNGQVAGIDVATGAVTKLGTAFPLDGDDFGFDFNPTVDRIRIHADSNDNLRVNPNNGALVDGDPGTAGVQPDPDLVNDPANVPAIADPNVTATAYTSSFPGTNRTQLYGIDTGDDSVVEFASPAATFQNVSRVSALGFDATDGAELDISARGRALAVLRSGTTAPKLYQVDINATTNPARDIGTIGGAADPVQELAITPRLRTFVALTNGSPQQLVRFRSDRPEAASAPVDVTGLPSGTTLVGIDTRNETGALYGVGDDERLYTLDPDTGAATVVGTGAFAPALAGNGFGVDFNPVPDRLRVTSTSEQNLRINPDTGAGSGLAPPSAADTALTNAADSDPDIVGSAYTNPKADAQNTTLFGIDSGTDRQVIQGGSDGTPSPNGGVLANAANALGVNVGNELGYDIVPEFNQGFIAADDAATAAVESNLYSVDSVQAPATAPGTAVLVGKINLPAGRLATGLAFLNDDVLTVGSPTAAVAEGGTATVTVLRSGPAEAAVSATVNLTAGSAGAGSDFGAVTPATVSFAPGETVKTVSIPTLNDSADEPTELFAASLGSPTNGAGIGKPSTTLVAIVDDDPTPTAPPAADTTRPVVTIGVADRIRTSDLPRGIRVRVGVSEAARIVGSLRFRGRTFARFTRTRSSAGVTTLRLRLSRSERRTLNRRRRSVLILSVSATDTAGNRRLVRERIAVIRR